ncbi:MAG TPA: hypothetical protein VE178_17475 [Silvibacterium sp.]|nr:hypothetical protein [Silvibacterium sp.]
MPSRLHLRIALPFASLLLAAAGCGTGQLAGMNAAAGAFSVTPSSATVTSNGQVKLTALLPSGDPAAVTWSISEGENAASLGEGHIDASGLYTPPGALSRNSAQIHVLARLRNNPAATSTAVINVTPGFVQSLLPENAAVTAGGAVEATAEIAEVSAGLVQWSLSSSPSIRSSSADPPLNLGTIDHASCQHSLDQFTTCKVSYTAPASLPPGSVVYLTASVNGTSATSPMKILLNNDGLNSNPSTNQSPQNGAIALGSSGGNDNDYDTYLDRSGNSYIADCCGGTLGALVEDSAHNQYVLSNNHVLAESDQAMIGDTIDEPGLIDNGCVPLSHAGSMLRSVGALKYYVPLANPQSNVDAALAAVVTGAVDHMGSILQLEAPKPNSSESRTSPLGAAPPMAGSGESLTAANLGNIELAKSSRTTGLTCSTVETVDLSVRIDYFKDCAETQPYYSKTFSGQIGIAGDKFSDSGDSGALIVDAANAQPVGLFFAGGTDGDGVGLSVANPIGDVLRELGTQAGSRMSIVGTSTPHKVACIRYDDPAQIAGSAVPVSSDEMARAQLVAETTGASLVNPESGILAVAAGKSLDNPGEAALLVYIDKVYIDKAKPRVSVPPTFEGLRTQLIPTDAAALARNAASLAPIASGIHLSDGVLAGAEAVVREYARRLMRDPAIFGVGVTQSHDNPADPALLVLVDIGGTPKSMPAVLGGLRVRYMRLHRFHVTQSKYSGPHPVSSCALEGLVPAGSTRPAVNAPVVSPSIDDFSVFPTN